MIAVVDYGVGNLFSILTSLRYLGFSAAATGEASEIRAAERIILPGVGAFRDAMQKLQSSGLGEVVKKEAVNGKPLLGVCLGMQLLFDVSLEFGEYPGLGLIPGKIMPMLPDLRERGYGWKIPQIGWNPLRFRRPDCPMLRYSRDGDSVYYVHSYYAKECEPYVAAESEYGVTVPGLVWKGSIFGTQFHPEKSGEKGLLMLRAFAEVNG